MPCARISVWWVALTGGALEVLCSWVSGHTCGSKDAFADILFFKNSLTSFALKSFTGKWLSGWAWAVADVAPVPAPAPAPAALPCLVPQAFPVSDDMACCRPLSLVGVFAPELRLAWPCRRQLRALLVSHCRLPVLAGRTDFHLDHSFSVYRNGGWRRGGVEWKI